ncbi:precorrin-3B synthase [Microvirga sp. BT689]|uniref:precorrin-3B synthase n=1 Tax=Microvirga arvi TaxID=2778731 RepID=UPI0019503585|nr:precorrin-3B synthase [Microvirga arvi]MBM6580188.1 precorrin-3B synthase [Microvirga arvi]
MNPQPISERRRGWCPGVRRPMETGDGLLVRLHPFGGRLTADQARLIAGAARENGNGDLDITARGNLQIRGVSEESHPELLALLEREGLAEPEGDGPNRLTVMSPLTGPDHGDVLDLAQEIEDRAVPLHGLPGKFFVTVDDGGPMPLDALGADLHVVATGEDFAIAFGSAEPKGLQWIGTASPVRADDAILFILADFAQMRIEGRTRARRLRDLEPALAAELAASAELSPATPPLERPSAPRAGSFQIRHGHAVLLALPFGRCSAAQLDQAAQWSERLGQGEIRLSFTRGILVPGIAGEHVLTLLAEASRAGFITDGDDPRLSLIACPGRQGCGSALTPAPADALRIAESCADILKDGAILHVSGCPKGCAHPGRAELTLVGREDGRYDVVPNGSTRDAASLHLSVDDLMTRLLPLATLDDLRRTFAEDAQ